MPQELGDGALGDVAAGVDDVDVVRQPLGVVHQVRRQDDAHAAVPQFGNEIEDHLAGLRVQARAGLVEEEDLRIAHQRRGQGEALLLAAGEAPHGVRLKVSMPRRPMSSSTGHGSWYMPAMCRSRGMGRADGGRPPSCSITPTRARSPAPAVSGILAQ